MSWQSLFTRCSLRRPCLTPSWSPSYTNAPVRTLLTHNVVRREVPKLHDRSKFQTPSEFLTAIGHSCHEKLQVESWNDFWHMNGREMKGKGVSVQDRRYILWAMEKFRLGEDPAQFSHPEKPKRKKIRGRGPAVQHGKRIRSRRDR